jgi:hypothetical protein
MLRLCTQGAEHCNKRLKQYAAEENYDRNAVYNVLRRQQAWPLLCADILVEQMNQKKKPRGAYKCSSCGVTGHTFRSQRCPDHKKYKEQAEDKQRKLEESLRATDHLYSDLGADEANPDTLDEPTVIVTED